MKVEYTLPALQPGTLPDLPSGPETTPSFRDQLRALAVELPESWEQQLRLDARPFTATYLGPPPRPRSLELNDPGSERMRWRNMLGRHGHTFDSPASPATAGRAQSVRTMLEMLHDMQQMEDAIVSQSVAVTRG